MIRIFLFSLIIALPIEICAQSENQIDQLRYPAFLLLISVYTLVYTFAYMQHYIREKVTLKSSHL